MLSAHLVSKLPFIAKVLEKGSCTAASGKVSDWFPQMLLSLLCSVSNTCFFAGTQESLQIH